MNARRHGSKGVRIHRGGSRGGWRGSIGSARRLVRETETGAHRVATVLHRGQYGPGCPSYASVATPLVRMSQGRNNENAALMNRVLEFMQNLADGRSTGHMTVQSTGYSACSLDAGFMGAHGHQKVPLPVGKFIHVHASG